MVKPVAPEPRNPHLVEEYKEALEFMRHDDQIAWTILGLCTTIAFGVWAYTFKDVPFRSWRGVVLTMLGVIVFGLGRLMVFPITKRTNWRKKRAKQIETELGFNLLSGLPSRRLRINVILTWVTVLAIVLWLLYFVSYLIWWRSA